MLTMKKSQFRLQEEMFAGAWKQQCPWKLHWTWMQLLLGGGPYTKTQTWLPHLHPISYLKHRRGQKQGGYQHQCRWKSCTELKKSVCVCVCCSAEWKRGGLLFICRLVQVQCVKKLRRRVKGRQAEFKSGCTFPRCAAWRRRRWRADSSPARAPGRCHNKERMINTQTHRNPIICSKPTTHES